MRLPRRALGAQQQHARDERERRERRPKPRTPSRTPPPAPEGCALRQRALEDDGEHGRAERAADPLETFSWGVASDSSERSSDAKAAVIAGMNPNPIPVPRTNIANDRNRIEVWSDEPDGSSAARSRSPR